uniref:Uncharacterized protein n=1 Tax=Moniliophthora roreri TaxID=221103 RepID=A0A0W0G7W5_MONRR
MLVMYWQVWNGGWEERGDPEKVVEKNAGNFRAGPSMTTKSYIPLRSGQSLGQSLGHFSSVLDEQQGPKIDTHLVGFNLSSYEIETRVSGAPCGSALVWIVGVPKRKNMQLKITSREQQRWSYITRMK